MAVKTWIDDNGNTFSEPYIPSKIVGFHGIDPDLIGNGSGGSGGSTGTGTDDHEELENLFGGDDENGHWHLRWEEHGAICSLLGLLTVAENKYTLHDLILKQSLHSIIDARIAEYMANHP